MTTLTSARLPLALVALALAACGAAPPPGGAPVHAPAVAVAPAPVAASPVPGADLGSRIDPLFARYSSGKTPGCAVGVVRAGEVAYAKGYGYASLAYDREISPATVFPLASLSKQMTAAAILLLAQDGKLALGDDVRRWIPELPDYGKPITLDHLLHHTSGVRDLVQLLPVAGHAEADAVSTGEALWLLTRQRSLNFPPGTDHLYSNSGYFLLSVVVQRITGKSLAAFEKERLFDPLGMVDTTTLEDPLRVVEGLATGYRATADGRFAVATRNIEASGYANVASTVGDLARWDASFYAPRVGGQALIDGLRETGTLADGTRLHYARGLVEGISHGLPWERHGGYLPGFRTEMLRYPSARLTVVVLCNDVAADVDDLAEKVARELLPPREPRAPKPAGAVGSAPFDAALAGTYVARERGDVRVFTPGHGRITVQAPLLGEPPEPLATIGATELRGEGESRWRFEPPVGKAPAKVVRHRVDGPAITYARVDPVSEVSPEALAKLAGRYASDEVGRDLALTLRGDEIFMGPWGGGTSSKPLRPLSRDAFMLGARLFTFERDARGNVTGVEVSSERVWRLRFIKRP